MVRCGLKHFSERFNLKLEQRVYKTYALRMANKLKGSPTQIVQNNS